jgi:hypothetical protein
VSQTLCKIDVLPAFALPMMSTLNRTFERGGAGAGAGTGDGDGDWDGDGDGDWAGVGDRVGPILPMARKRCEKKYWERC